MFKQKNCVHQAYIIVLLTCCFDTFLTTLAANGVKLSALRTSSRGTCHSNACITAFPKHDFRDVLTCDSQLANQDGNNTLSEFRRALETFWSSGLGDFYEERLLRVEQLALHIWHSTPFGRNSILKVENALLGGEPDEDLKGFCCMAYLSAIFILLQRPQLYLAPDVVVTMAELLRDSIFGNRMPLIWFSSSSGWPVPAAEMLHLADARLQQPTLSDARRVWPRKLSTALAKASTSKAGFSVGAVSGHTYIFDSLLGVLEACQKMGMESEGKLYGFTMARFIDFSKRLCQDAGDVCRHNQRLHDLSLGVTDYTRTSRADVGADNMQMVLTEVRGFLNEEMSVQVPDVVVCGYPYVFCIAIEQVRPSLNLLLVVQGTVLTEYTNPEVYPWLFTRFVRWMNPVHSTGKRVRNQRGFRGSLVHDHIDQHLYDVGLGVRMPHVLYCSRHVALMVKKGIGVELGTTEAAALRKVAPRRCLVSGLTKLMPERDAFSFFATFSLAASVLEGDWNVEWRLDPYEYSELLTYSAAAMIPWDWEITTFFEWYKLNMPLFIPSQHWMVAFITWSFTSQADRFIRLRPKFWRSPAHAENATAIARFGGAGRHQRPWIDVADPHWSIVEQVAWWYQFTDFVRIPHLTYFDGPPDLMAKLSNHDLDSTAQNMQRYNEASLQASQDFFRRVLVSVLATSSL